jgi:hypothetical protein
MNPVALETHSSASREVNKEPGTLNFSVTTKDPLIIKGKRIPGETYITLNGKEFEGTKGKGNSEEALKIVMQYIKQSLQNGGVKNIGLNGDLGAGHVSRKLDIFPDSPCVGQNAANVLSAFLAIGNNSGQGSNLLSDFDTLTLDGCKLSDSSAFSYDKLYAIVSTLRFNLVLPPTIQSGSYTGMEISSAAVPLSASTTSVSSSPATSSSTASPTGGASASTAGGTVSMGGGVSAADLEVGIHANNLGRDRKTLRELEEIANRGGNHVKLTATRGKDGQVQIGHASVKLSDLAREPAGSKDRER